MDKNLYVLNFLPWWNFLGKHLFGPITSEILDVSFRNKIISDEWSLGKKWCKLCRGIFLTTRDITENIRVLKFFAM